jgi:Dolichyl-phosphate-mannose-protein mannosyltransferase
MTRSAKLLLIPLGSFLLVLFLALTRYRFIDADEGFYLLASRLVLLHKIPYLDFFYTQMPLLPYVYGSWMHFFGESWLTGRALSACLTATLGMLLYAHICTQTGKWAAGVIAALLFSCTTLIFAWLPIVKTFALSSVLLFACYMVASRFTAFSSKWSFGFSGFLLGLSIETRLYFAVLAPVLLLWIYRNVELRKKWTALLVFLGGLLIATVPSFYLLAIDPNAYLFNNVGYHAIRSDSGLIGGIGQKLAVVIEALITGPHGNGLQLGLLFLVSLSLVQKKRLAGPARLAFELAIVLAVVCLLPTPAYVQYFCVVVPFLLVATVCPLTSVLADPNGKRSTLLKTAICGASLSIYFAMVIGDYRKYFITGEGLNGIYFKKDPANWTLPAVRAVSGAVDEFANSGESVMSFWPGYIFESKAIPYPRFENDAGRTISATLTDSQLTKYHLVSRSIIEAEIAGRKPRIVVVGNQEYWHEHQQPYVEALERSGYVVARIVGGASIYTRVPTPQRITTAQ